MMLFDRAMFAKLAFLFAIATLLPMPLLMLLMLFRALKEDFDSITVTFVANPNSSSATNFRLSPMASFDWDGAATKALLLLILVVLMLEFKDDFSALIIFFSSVMAAFLAANLLIVLSSGESPNTCTGCAGLLYNLPPERIDDDDDVTVV